MRPGVRGFKPWASLLHGPVFKPPTPAGVSTKETRAGRSCIGAIPCPDCRGLGWRGRRIRPPSSVARGRSPHSWSDDRVTARPDEPLAAALAYAARGWPTFRLNGKVPLAGSRGFKDATVDPDVISSAWGSNPHANVGSPRDRQAWPSWMLTHLAEGIALSRFLNTSMANSPSHLALELALGGTSTSRHRPAA